MDIGLALFLAFTGIILSSILFLFLKSQLSLGSEQIKRLIVPNLEVLKQYGPNMYISVPQGTKYELNILLSKYFASGEESAVQDLVNYTQKNMKVKNGEINPCYALLIKLINKVISEQSMTPGTFQNQFITKKEFIVMKKKSPMANTFVTLIETKNKKKEYYALFFEGKVFKNISESVNNLFNEISNQHGINNYYLPTMLVIGFNKREKINNFSESEVSLPSGMKYKLSCVVCYDAVNKKYISFKEEDESKLADLPEKSYCCYGVWAIEAPEVIEEAEVMGFVPGISKSDEKSSSNGSENEKENKNDESKKEVEDENKDKPEEEKIKESEEKKEQKESEENKDEKKDQNEEEKKNEENMDENSSVKENL